jgi:hypothetical protein
MLPTEQTLKCVCGARDAMTRRGMCKECNELVERVSGPIPSWQDVVLVTAFVIVVTVTCVLLMWPVKP